MPFSRLSCCARCSAVYGRDPPVRSCLNSTCLNPARQHARTSAGGAQADYGQAHLHTSLHTRLHRTNPRRGEEVARRLLRNAVRRPRRRGPTARCFGASRGIERRASRDPSAVAAARWVRCAHLSTGRAPPLTRGTLFRAAKAGQERPEARPEARPGAGLFARPSRLPSSPASGSS